MSDYRIELGIGLKTDDLADIKKKINSLEDNPIKLKVDAETKELTSTIREALNSLSKGTKNSLTLDTSKLETSLGDIALTIKDIKASIGALDSGSGMKSLLSSINQISTALEKASNQFEGLNKSLNALSGKDLNLNFGISLGSSNSVARNAVYGSKVRGETLPQLKEQMSALVKYYNNTYKESLSEFEALQKLVSGTKLSNGDFFESFLFGKDSVAARMSGGSLASQMQAYKQYIDMFKQAASLKGLDLSSVTSGFSKSADELIKDAQDIQTGAKEMEESFEKLKQVFGGGNNLNIEGISAQLDSIVVDLGEIKTALQGLSSGISVDGLTQSFDRLSETLEKLVSNLTLAKNTLDTGFSNAAPVNNAVKTAQQTGQKIGETISKSAKQSINLNDVIDEQTLKLMDEYAISGGKSSKAFGEIRQSLVDFKNGSGDINKITSAISNNMKVVNEAKNDYKDLAEHIKMINASGAKIHIPDSIRQEYGDDYKTMRSQLGRAFTSGQGMDFESFIEETNEILGQTIDLSHGAEAAFGDLVNKVNSTKGGKTLTGDDLFRSGLLDMGDVIANVSTSLEQIENAEEEIAQASAVSANTVVQNEEKKQQVYRETASEAKKLDSILIDISDGNVDDLKNALRNIKVDDSSIENATKELSDMNIVAKNVSGTLKNGNLAKWEIKGVQSMSDGLERAVTITKTLGKEGWENSVKYSQAFDKMADAAQKIKNKLNDTGFDGYEAEVQRVHTESEKLESSTVELEAALKRLDVAMDAINSADEANDVKRLVSANEEYEAALKQVYSQLKLNQQLEKASVNAQKLDDDIKLFQSDIDSWLTKNSAAADKFGAELSELKAKAENCDRTELNHLRKQFKMLDKEAEKAGLKMQSFSDRLKTKLKEYSAYFSVAEVFMYVTQGLKDMFDQVVAIDSAMTELKKVTNETDSSYNQFLTNASSRAKELGITIDGLVASAADFARLGFEFGDVQGLAEVANIYSVVGDDIDSVETATQSLISTMTAFKDEMNGLSDSDFALSIVDKMNEVSNNFAISSGGIGEALQRSASSMAAANNTMDETIALITAANTVVQDPDSVGTAFKTKNLIVFMYRNVHSCTHLKPVKPKALSLQCG